MSFTELKIPSECRNCGGTCLKWFADVTTQQTAVNGARFRLNEVQHIFVLGCEECSETLLVARGDDIAELLNAPSLVSAALLVPQLHEAINAVLDCWHRAGPQGSHQFEKFDHCIRLCRIAQEALEKVDEFQEG